MKRHLFVLPVLLLTTACTGLQFESDNRASAEASIVVETREAQNVRIVEVSRPTRRTQRRRCASWIVD